MNEIEQKIKELEDTLTCKYCIHIENKEIDCKTCEAIRLYEAGYRKQVWHKIADGDLPDYCKRVIVVVKDDITNQNVILSGSRHNSDFGDDWWLGEYQGCDVTAWTELPEYKGD